MKVLILYYSQTGSTQQIARKIRDGLRRGGAEVTLRFLKHADYSELPEYDMLGFGSPVWFEMPPNMRRFLEEMPAQPGKIAFSFCTHATLPDLYFPLVIPRLQNRGLRVLDWRDWYADCTLQPFPKPYYTAGHPDAQDLWEAEAWGSSLADTARRLLAGENVALPAAPKPHMTPEHANAAIQNLGGFHNIHGKLVRDETVCRYPKCRICTDNCPMGYIDLENGSFGSCGDACDDPHGCTYCELLCPSGAIRPEIPYEQAAPVGVRHHYALFCEALDRAEREGRFRRLIPEDEVGEETPYYSVHPRHPRVKPLSFRED